MKIFIKHCECLKIKAKFWEGVEFLVDLIWENFKWNIIKLASKNLRKYVKKQYSIVTGTCFQRIISFISSPFGVSSLFHHTRRTLCSNPWNQLAFGVLKLSDKNVIMVFLLPILPSFGIRETIHRLFSPDSRENYCNFSELSIFPIYVLVIFNVDR